MVNQPNRGYHSAEGVNAVMAVAIEPLTNALASPVLTKKAARLVSVTLMARLYMFYFLAVTVLVFR